MEHVFDVKNFVHNCIKMTKKGGTLFIYDALVGWHNECFYNFQTPFFFDVFKANGFENIALYLNYFPKYHDFGSTKTRWQKFEHNDRPRFRRKNYCTHVLFVGNKKKQLPRFVTPMQGYYAEYYNDFKEAIADGEVRAEHLSHYMIENMPSVIQRFFKVLIPIYLFLPTWLRTPIVDTLIAIKNHKKNASRDSFYV